MSSILDTCKCKDFISIQSSSDVVEVLRYDPSNAFKTFRLRSFSEHEVHGINRAKDLDKFIFDFYKSHSTVFRSSGPFYNVVLVASQDIAISTRRGPATSILCNEPLRDYTRFNVHYVDTDYDYTLLVYKGVTAYDSAIVLVPIEETYNKLKFRIYHSDIEKYSRVILNK